MSQNNVLETYLAQFDGVVLERLIELRRLVKKLCPEADEGYSYGLVGYKLNKRPLLYFGGFKNHVGLYATPNGHEAFKEEFAPYKQGKGSVRFPNDQPLPLELIRRVIEFRVGQVAHG
jgi:uncharacterized protein YdhG (YjbR/CyaY superfamily)